MSRIIFAEGSAPDLPPANKVEMYAKTNGKVYTKDDAGEEHVLSQDSFGINYQFGDDTLVIQKGFKGMIQSPFDCKLTGVQLFSTISGSIIVDILRDTGPNLPLTGYDSICGGNYLTLSNQRYYSNTTLSGWTTDISAGDYIGFDVRADSTTCYLVNVALMGKKK